MRCFFFEYNNALFGVVTPELVYFPVYYSHFTYKGLNIIVTVIKKRNMSVVTNAQQYGLNIFVFDSEDSWKVRFLGLTLHFLSSCLLLNFDLLFSSFLLEKHAKCVGWKQMSWVCCHVPVITNQTVFFWLCSTLHWELPSISLILKCHRCQFHQASLYHLINLLNFFLSATLLVFLCRYGYKLQRLRVHFKCISLNVSSRGFWTVFTSHSFALALYLEPYAVRYHLSSEQCLRLLRIHPTLMLFNCSQIKWICIWLTEDHFSLRNFFTERDLHLTEVCSTLSRACCFIS